MKIAVFYSIGAFLFLSCSAICTSCSKDDSNLSNGEDELGVPYVDNFDAYGVQVWTPDEANADILYSRIDTLYRGFKRQKTVQYYTSNGEESNVHWSSSARIDRSVVTKDQVDSEYGEYFCVSTVELDLSKVDNAYTVEALIATNGQVVRRFQTIPVRIVESYCDIFACTFGTMLEQMVYQLDMQHSLNTENLKVRSFYVGESPIELFRFTDAPEQKLEVLYCTASGLISSGSNLIYACEVTHIPETPQFENQPGHPELRVLNPQQWEFNGLRFTLYNTTWQDLGVVSDDVSDREFACLSIEKR